MKIAISTQNLTRTYQSYKKPEGFKNSLKGFFNRQYIEKTALHPLSLDIEAGTIVGLVGSNGAGKTTLLKMLSGLIQPSSGSASVLGYNPAERKSDFLKQMSILLGQKNQLWWDIPANDSYAMLSAIYDLDEAATLKRAKELAGILNCTHVLDVQLRRLSLGERMKMEIIGSLLHKPKVLFLDEPTIGLDVVAQATIRSFLTDYVKTEKPTVILTSHYMDDIAQLADRLLLLSQGKIVYDGEVDAFVKRANPKQKITALLQNNRIISQEMPINEIGHFVSELVNESPISEIKIEETDFEDVIREFLAQDQVLR